MILLIPKMIVDVVVNEDECVDVKDNEEDSDVVGENFGLKASLVMEGKFASLYKWQKLSDCGLPWIQWSGATKESLGSGSGKYGSRGFKVVALMYARKR